MQGVTETFSIMTMEFTVNECRFIKTSVISYMDNLISRRMQVLFEFNSSNLNYASTL